MHSQYDRKARLLHEIAYWSMQEGKNIKEISDFQSISFGFYIPLKWLIRLEYIKDEART